MSSSVASTMPGLNTYTETFEAYNGSSYATGTFALTTGSWYVVAAYKDSETHGGSVSVRLNDDVAGSCLVSPVMNGLGSVSFWYRALNAESADSTFKVQTSVNGGTTWSDAGSGTFKTQTWAQYSCTINSTAGSIQFRVLNDNQAGHLILDDLVFTSYNVTGGSVSSSASAVSSATSSVSSAGFSSSSSSSSLGTSSSAGGGTVLTENMSLPQSVRDYYRSAYGLSGSALKSALHTIISTGYTRYVYGWDQ
ncbi:MAG TPA: choice-of-anchor J domain-containing protein, partial [Spirochaetota bacterium]|nr:choice-of-anchor J domain-containing protein [Spirochaetota bacterium]